MTNRQDKKTVDDLAQTGQVDEARQVISRQPPGVVVVEVNRTTTEWTSPRRRRTRR
jgi:hypothetical protein